MTDKQIIIDGVDVSECIYFAKREDGCKCEKFYNENCFCEIRTDCYYKQLQRLKEHHHKTECEASENLKKLVKLEQECEELKKQLQKYKDNEQQEKELQKLYNKFEGSSLIEARTPNERI